VLDEVALAAGADRRLDDAATRLAGGLAAARGDPAAAEGEARRLVERLAVVLQGALLVRHAPAAVADAFCATRVAGEGGAAFGTLPPGTGTAAIVERAAPFA
ncbi:MAG TPA: DNA alkylation response protein, partial [Acidimicrobiales bacterium]|nr:DNA alkylation response protein [Acidimicrobiales bacterium]